MLFLQNLIIQTFHLITGLYAETGYITNSLVPCGGTKQKVCGSLLPQLSSVQSYSNCTKSKTVGVCGKMHDSLLAQLSSEKLKRKQ